MNIDPGQIQQVLGQAHFPVDKNTLIQVAQQHGANDQVVGMLQKLPDKSFNSIQDVQEALGGLGNIGGLHL
jgi:hypothetical protein